MASYPFCLQPYSGPGSRYTCPACGRKRVFTRYIKTACGSFIAEHVGRCSRLTNCGYHLPPRQYFKQQGTSSAPPAAYLPPATLTPTQHPSVTNSPLPAPPPQPTYYPVAEMKKTLCNYHHNHLVSYLKTLGRPHRVEQLCEDYRLGTGTVWPGSTVFWQIDVQGRVRGGKVMLYNPQTGKRVKQPYNHLTWVHSALRLPNYHLQQCLFGEHLLGLYPYHTVALVESEKTALTGALYCPDNLWLATGGLENLTPARCQALQHRHVILYPDLNAYPLWQQKAQQLKTLTLHVSDMLEVCTNPTQRQHGYDLADYLVQHNAWQLV